MTAKTQLSFLGSSSPYERVMVSRAVRRVLSQACALGILTLAVRLSTSGWWPVVVARFITEAVEDAILCANEPNRFWCEVPKCVTAFWSHNWRYTLAANPSIPLWLRR